MDSNLLMYGLFMYAMEVRWVAPSQSNMLIFFYDLEFGPKTD